MKIDRCPRCGAPGYLIEDKRELKTGSQVYYFVLHRYKDTATGKWKTRKCSIGSEEYIYVTKTHVLPYYNVSLRLSNVVKTERLLDLAIRSVENIITRLKTLDIEKRSKELEKLKPRITRLVELVETLNAFPKLETS
ncbi:MAG: hypothetical protein QXJ97_09860 [Desulfurococcaceae archaeon]